MTGLTTGTLVAVVAMLPVPTLIRQEIGPVVHTINAKVGLQVGIKGAAIRSSTCLCLQSFQSWKTRGQSQTLSKPKG